VARLAGTGRLADDLYLLAHHEVTGRAHLAPRASGLGLAGALLAELMLERRIMIWPDAVVVADAAPAQDGLARNVLDLLRSERQQLPARDWLLFLARSAAEDVAGRLAQSGYLTPAPGRWWRGQRWVPVNPDWAFAPVNRVLSVLDPARPKTVPAAALAGLALACGLGPRVLLYAPPDARRGLEEAAGQLGPGLRDLITATRAAVDCAVLSHRA
jgi:hypothetical protein